ncbi:hypothetical protein THASP1DRAFT_23361 [Thamnocephalis sphaerospora]|uniref:Uncharacterized protein n=1 Tax=Thamnocephalis sphaerospora TaxID=78915 RepID=A0A4P9XRH5_9FUNG|nr:hypothetical protein THASP1DRAFT_23361 [Thamnocephalis sphaerospora]|eukprot:RKP08697.1 hypothetical protein THASP1DRAFT_23361 [Thamnocephalis sphaerospora]
MKHTSTQITFTLLAIAAITVDTTSVSAVPIRLNVPLTTWYVNVEGERYNDEVNGRGASALWAIANENNIGINGQTGIHIPPDSNEISWNAGMEANGLFKSGWKGSASGHAALNDGKFSQFINGDSRLAVFGGTSVRTSASASSYIGHVDGSTSVSGDGRLDSRFTIPRNVKENGGESNDGSAKQKQHTGGRRNFELGGGVSTSGDATIDSGSVKLTGNSNVNGIFQTAKQRTVLDATLGGSSKERTVPNGLEAENKLQGKIFTDLNGSEKTVEGKIHSEATVNASGGTVIAKGLANADGTVKSDDGTNIRATAQSTLNGNAKIEQGRLMAGSSTRNTALVFSKSKDGSTEPTDDGAPTFISGISTDVMLNGMKFGTLGTLDVEYRNGKASLDISKSFAFPKTVEKNIGNRI